MSRTACVRAYIWALFVVYCAWTAFIFGWSATRSRSLWIFVPAVIAQCIEFIGFGAFLFVLLWWKDETSKGIDHIATLPTIDILLPRHCEPWSVYKKTIESALALDYPPNKVAIYVLDDGPGAGIRDEYLAQVAHPRIKYIQRSTNEHKKAGNLNNALPMLRGDFLSVIDADFVVEPSFIKTLIGHFYDADGAMDDSISYIQTPQTFSNSSVQTKLQDQENVLFYELIMPGLNGLGSPICVGTSYIMKRAHIVGIGGYCTGTATEDNFTALKMHIAGKKGIYMNAKLSHGTTPDTLASITAQKLRWSSGSLQMLWYFRRDLLRVQSIGQFIGYMIINWYPYLSTATVLMIFVRLALFFVYLTTPHESSVGVLVSTFATPVMFLMLPLVGIQSKIRLALSFLGGYGMYIQTISRMWTGRLNPQRQDMQKSSSEASRCGIPLSSILPILFGVLFIAASVVVMALPQAFNLTAVDYTVVGLTISLILGISFSSFANVATTIYAKFTNSCVRRAASETDTSAASVTDACENTVRSHSISDLV
jgi:cellulose synthase/poly-beta-1,6-N-acetylglucosamine synthase-like glycosyltransferase